MNATETELKHCWSCDNWFPATPEYFHRDKTKRDGLHGCCKSCKIQTKDKWQKANPDRLKVYQERCRYPNGKPLPFPTINRMAENIKYIWGVKELGCCVCCGEVRPEVLLFHHKHPKDKIFNLSSPKYRPLDEIKSEIDACDIMCANCHMSLHYWERHP